MSQAKIFKLLSEAYGLTWSGGIAAEVIDGCPVTLKEDRYYVQVSAYMPERVYEAKHEIFNEQMKAVKGVKCGFDKKTSRITTVLSQPNRVVEQYGRSARLSNSTQLLMLRKTSVLTADRANVIWQLFIIINTGESMCGVISIIQTGRGMLCCPVRAIWQWESSVLSQVQCSLWRLHWQSASLQKDLMVGFLSWQRSQR